MKQWLVVMVLASAVAVPGVVAAEDTTPQRQNQSRGFRSLAPIVEAPAPESAPAGASVSVEPSAPVPTGDVVSAEVTRLDRLRETNQKDYEVEVGAREAELRDRLAKVKESNPDAYEALVKKIGEKRHAAAKREFTQLQELAKKDPEVFHKRVEARRLRLAQRLNRVPEQRERAFAHLEERLKNSGASPEEIRTKMQRIKNAYGQQPNHVPPAVRRERLDDVLDRRPDANARPVEQHPLAERMRLENGQDRPNERVVGPNGRRSSSPMAIRRGAGGHSAGSRGGGR